jgi:hypothetical protein
MNTRWHEEEVAGRVLEQIERKEIKGRVISIPAIAEENDPLGRKPGEYLWDDPDGYDYGAITGSGLVSASVASVPIWESVTTCLALEKMPIATQSDRSAGIGTSMTSRLVLSLEPSASL